MEKPSSASDGKPAALFLAPEAPYPAVGGGALHAAALLEYLARRYAVDIVVFREPGARDPAKRLPAGLVRRIHVIDLPFHSRAMGARVVRNCGRFLRGVPPLNDRFAGFSEQLASFLSGRRYELGVVEHFWCAGYWEPLARHCRTTVLDLLDVESSLQWQLAETEPWPASLLFHRFRRACLKLERRWLPMYSLLLTTSQEDAARVREIVPGCRVEVYPNTIPLPPLPRKQEEDVIIFSGNLEYQPNVGAVRFFRQRIWPRLRDQWPGLVWRLIGKNPQAVREYLAGDARIDLRGPVADAIGALAKAKVAVVPLLAGSGTRVKILEAWAAGTPVVSTGVGAEGLMIRDGEHLLVANEPEAFAGAVARLLASEELRKQVGQAGRSLLQERFTWEAGWSVLQRIGI